MQRITIKNFGPIKEIIDLPINDFMVFIGPQASGKSTIAKVVYFFRTLNEDLSNHFINSLKKDKENVEIKSEVINLIRKRLVSIWPDIILNNNAEISFSYNEVNILITIINEQLIINGNVFFDAKVEETLKILSDYKPFLNVKFSTLSQTDKAIYNSKYLEFVTEIITLWNKILGISNEKSTVFIPAGRSSLSLLDEYSDDSLVEIFSKYIRSAIRDSISGQKQYITWQTRRGLSIDESYSLALQLGYTILKGDYDFDEDEEVDYLAIENRRLKLIETSSGQQEALWIVEFILMSLLKKESSYTIIEEPEAHLYPEAQRDIVQLIALLANQADNQVLITTHSPYILSAINNLMYAYQMGSQKPNETDALIKKYFWLNPARVSSYFVDKGKIENIIDSELNLIKVESLDSASSIINNEYDKLFELEV